jgi:hypothetical protein
MPTMHADEINTDLLAFCQRRLLSPPGTYSDLADVTAGSLIFSISPLAPHNVSQGSLPNGESLGCMGRSGPPRPAVFGGGSVAAATLMLGRKSIGIDVDRKHISDAAESRGSAKRLEMI